ncbi:MULTISPECIES: hypothetical protein [Acinetobacter]|uniref:Uncharacterized protein n=1 Tax=Acinetobacter entericus TaxID=2989714 RepID=A0ABT3NFH2_9GAMM|nr:MULTISPECIES: hypothetical protein [Acinetobacter]MCW8038024.1 hypothetical protein [Acinetobacter entericus]
MLIIAYEFSFNPTIVVVFIAEDSSQNAQAGRVGQPVYYGWS